MMSLNFCVWFVVFAIAGAFIYAETRNRLTVINESGQPAHDLTVTVGGEALQFRDLSPGASKRARFRIGDEGNLLVRGRLADGQEIDDYVGYIVGEESLLGINAVLTIRPRGELEFCH
ncbi:MAG TPA: hypothetical protein VKS79_01005 [Gemmataceae bacterium]|nr:hypothetical protein [Gemmataceae bacterium]